MGTRGAMARLGLRLAAAISRDLKPQNQHKHQHHKDMMISRKVSSFSPLFIRKSSTSTSFSSATAAVAEVKKKGAGSSEWKSKLELKDDRSLYLCFKGTDKGIVMRSIKLSHLLSSSWWWPTETEGWWLKDTHIFCKSGPSCSGSGGKKFQPKRRRDNCKFPSALIKRMKEGPEDTLMMKELLPLKIYCVATDLCVHDTSDVFQVLDMSCSRKWVSLDAPPVNMSKTYPWHDLCAAAVGTKVLAWSMKEEGVHCFDVTQPEQGWTKFSSSLGAFIPFLLDTNPCFVQLQDQNGGNNYFLMFVLDGKEGEYIQIQGFLMSHTGDTLQPLHEPLPLPALPFEIVPESEEEGIVNPVNWHCVHLGSQKLCIVVGKLWDMTCGCVFLITLEYELITNSKSSSLDIQYRWLSTRHFGYVGPENVSYPHLLTALVL